MPDESWSAPRLRSWARARIRPRGNWWKLVNGCMLREWRPPYDPLSWPPRRTWVADVVWRFHLAVPAVSGGARRFPERCQGEFADICGDAVPITRPIWSGATAAGALL